jgi:hypothetical protein
MLSASGNASAAAARSAWLLCARLLAWYPAEKAITAVIARSRLR